jgi:predicted transcriptional regulator
MKRSKLEMHVDILKVIANKGPLQMPILLCEAKVNCNVLKEHLDFLIKQGLVAEISVDKNSVVYANTGRGTSVIRFFGQLDKSFPAKQEEIDSVSFPIENGN